MAYVHPYKSVAQAQEGIAEVAAHVERHAEFLKTVSELGDAILEAKKVAEEYDDVETGVEGIWIPVARWDDIIDAFGAL